MLSNASFCLANTAVPIRRRLEIAKACLASSRVHELSTVLQTFIRNKNNLAEISHDPGDIFLSIQSQIKTFRTSKSQYYNAPYSSLVIWLANLSAFILQEQYNEIRIVRGCRMMKQRKATDSKKYGLSPK